MSKRFAAHPAAGRAHLALLAVLALILGVLLNGLVNALPAHADTASGVSIDLGGAGGGGFVADAYGSGGSADSLPGGAATFPNWGPTVAHPIAASVWNTSRVGESHYVVPGLTPGVSYQARLYFMDWYFTHAGQREFDVAVNGTKVLTNFDIIGTAINAGADGQEAFGVERDFPVTVDASGTATFDFTRDGADQPQVNAIVLVPANSNGVSIDLGGAGGGGFVADAYGSGGSADSLPGGAATFPNWGPTVAHPIAASVWNTSRVGESHYVVPGLTPGVSYQARLYFMDWYFTHAGQREFDVAVNGTKVLTNFDIIGTATNAGADGQEAFGVERDFPVTVDASGTVTFDFTRDGANQPQVNAIVLVPTS
ncbi:malectin domain-containing carbohydrate-binding protein [Streptacidiphilus sp. N1-3]|uniref:Malectin domain-containing carbohydrate-binding protein n=1 Tax=Streptacidiphilus alkalitolerans TaxID=3342712 RepID=A0ABV6X1C2_9ACTN